MLNTTTEEIKTVLHLRDDEELSFANIAEKLGFSERTARRRYEAGVLRRALWAGEEPALDEFPEAPPVELPEIRSYLPETSRSLERLRPLEAYGNAILACDFHIPLHDPALINVMINAAKDADIKHLIIPGDYFHMEAFSSFLPHQPEASLEVERYEGNLVMKTLLEWFDTIDIIWGNHDFRLTKALNFKKSFIETMRWMLPSLTPEEWQRVRISSLDYMYYYPIEGGLKFRLCHPRNFSSVPLAVGLKLAAKHKCSVYTAHSHHFAMGFAYNGQDMVIEGGGLFLKGKTEYIQKTTTNHEWVPGFTLFKEGVPYMISPNIGNDHVYRKEVQLNGSLAEEGMVHV